MGTSRPSPREPAFAGWSLGHVAGVAREHPLPCAFALSLLLFMGVEYTIPMVPASSPPLDVGFAVTESLHHALAANLALNTLLAVLNTVFVGMQALYIVWTLMVEGRPQPTIAALFMFTGRGILPLPHEFLASGADFPVGNVSFFLFFSGHVAGAVIASLDTTTRDGVGVRRPQRAAERAAAGLSRALHHRFGRRRRRRLRVRRIGS
ncbi:hypothetical protein Cni_G05620 [Canna indica]|uniref:AtPDCT1/2 transmembrane domain-containing protein n=1 Tax=Canna indica TaxID=4628 RepID=A0AAQ3JVH1_9LILI|nr:hypothetical protein Cni_G05620 [Canna indica]